MSYDLTRLRHDKDASSRRLADGIAQQLDSGNQRAQGEDSGSEKATAPPILHISTTSAPSCHPKVLFHLQLTFSLSPLSSNIQAHTYTSEIRNVFQRK